MGRLQVLEKEINKGILVDEKSNVLLNNWSPNNVRRLIIGYDFALVNYFVTGPKYNKLLQVVDFRRVAQKDDELYQTEPQKYKSILSVLTTGRICSSIEEIIFCTNGYPPHLLAIDSDISKLAGSNVNLENRFVRLRHVSLVNNGVQNTAVLVEKAKSAETLVLDVLKESGSQVNTIANLHEDNWWKGVSLRPKYYSMDADILPKYFSKLKERLELQERESLLEEIDSQKDIEAVTKSLPAILAVIKFTFALLEKGEDVFKKSSIVSKAEWSNVLTYRNSCRGIRKELNYNEDTLKEYRKINFEKLLKTATLINTPEEDIKLILKFRVALFTDILNNEEEYKRESNRGSLNWSIQTLQKLTASIFNAECNIVYLSFAKYLTRNTPEYAEFFYSQLGVDLSSIIYTRSIMEYCNKNIENGWSKQAMDKIGVKEVLQEQLTLPLKNNISNKLLTALLSAK